MKKINLLILPSIFFGLIFFFFFNQIGQWITFKQTDENRNFKKMPAFNINKLDDFPAAYDEYLNDNFTFRVPFLHAYHELKYQMQISPDPERVIIGADGHLFMGMWDKEIYRGTRSFEQPQLDSMAQIWQDRKNYFKQKNIQVYWTVVPFNYHVYKNKLPINVYEHKGNRTQKLEDYFAKKHPGLMTYPLDELKAAGEKELVYFKLDNHWNEKGGWIAYQSIMKMLQKKNPELIALSEADISWKTELRKEGALANFIGKKDELLEKVPLVSFRDSDAGEIPKFNFPPPKGFPNPEQYELGYLNPKAKNKKRVLIIRDSFGVALMPFMKATFGETLFIFDGWQYKINEQIIETYKPDIVIFINAEAHLENILNDPGNIRQ